MRVALISDIHGNIAALDAVLAHISSQQVDLTVDLGDIVSGGLHPRCTADRLMIAQVPTLAGNHERQLLTRRRDQMGDSDRHAHDRLTDDHRDWLRSLPSSLDLGSGVLCVQRNASERSRVFLGNSGSPGMSSCDQSGGGAASFAVRRVGSDRLRPYPSATSDMIGERDTRSQPRQCRHACLWRQPSLPARHGIGDAPRAIRGD